MSYCRFGPDSDVYLYADILGGYSLHTVNKHETFRLKTLPEVQSKLQELRESGLQVPEFAFERLRREIEEGEPSPGYTDQD